MTDRKGLKGSNMDTNQVECLIALVSLLLKSEPLKPLLGPDSPLMVHIARAITMILSGRTANWNFFQCACIFIAEPRGAELLKLCGLDVHLTKIGGKWTDSRSLPEAFGYFRGSELSKLTCDFFYGFLLCKNFDVFNVALDEMTKFKLETIYKDVLVRFLKTDLTGAEEARRDWILTALHGILLKNRNCLKLTAGDPEVHEKLWTLARPPDSILFSIHSAIFEKVDQENQWWLDDTNSQNYLNEFQRFVTTGTNGEYPPHLFSSLAKTEQGQAKVVPWLPILVERIQSEMEVVKLAAIFAVTHFGSEKSTHNDLRKCRAIEQILGQWDSVSYTSKGMIISALSIVAHSTYFSGVLVESHWQLFKFGDHVSVFPNNVTEIEPENSVFVSERPVELNATQSLIQQLSSPITLPKAKQALEATDQKILQDPELAKFAWIFMSRFSLPSDVREFLLKTFSQTPILVDQTPQELNEDVAALMRARLFEAVKGSRNTLTPIKVPVVPLDQVTQVTVCPSCPELYLSDADFLRVAAMSKAAFYKLPKEARADIRAAIMKKA
jgi:hypothetical protein